MNLSGYINAPEETTFISLRHGMKYLMHNTYETIIYSRKNILKLNNTPHQYFFKEGST